jgi:hypothetical protein
VRASSELVHADLRFMFMCVDIRVLRVMSKPPATVKAFRAWIARDRVDIRGVMGRMGRRGRRKRMRAGGIPLRWSSGLGLGLRFYQDVAPMEVGKLRVEGWELKR